MDRSARSGPITAVSTLVDRFFQAWKTRSAPTPPSTFSASARRWTPARPCNSRPSPIQATDTRAPWDHPLDTQPTPQPTAAPDLNPWYLDSPSPLPSPLYTLSLHSRLRSSCFPAPSKRPLLSSTVPRRRQRNPQRVLARIRRPGKLRARGGSIRFPVRPIRRPVRPLRVPWLGRPS